MEFFNRKRKHQEELAKLNTAIEECFEYREINTNPSKTVTFTADSTPVEEPAAAASEEEWVWVDGFKGTNKDMKAYDNFQYELGVDYNVAEPDEVSTCNYGYHLCLKLDDVYEYYDLKNGNRFFKVRALVRKRDYEQYGHYPNTIGTFVSAVRINKLAAKTIILTEEIVDEKILVEAYYISRPFIAKLPDEWNKVIVQKGFDKASKECYCKKLIDKGYSEIFANIIVEQYSSAYLRRALAIADEEEVSMDMKVWFIFAGGD